MILLHSHMEVGMERYDDIGEIQGSHTGFRVTPNW